MRPFSSAFAVLLVLSFGVTAFGQADIPPSEIVATKDTITFDPKTCVEGSAGISTGVQGARVKVLGRRGGFCEFEYVTDGCGGCFAYYLCKVPLDAGPVRVEVANGSIKTSLTAPTSRLATVARMAGLSELTETQAAFTPPCCVAGASDMSATRPKKSSPACTSSRKERIRSSAASESSLV